MDFEREVRSLPLAELIEKFPISEDFLKNYGLDHANLQLPLVEAVRQKGIPEMLEMGLTAEDMADLLCDFLECTRPVPEPELRCIEILGGKDKDGIPEITGLTVASGEVVSLVGPTGAGKSQLLADIECAARGDTPTSRVILFNGTPLADGERFSVASRLVAQLTQSMNFVIDVSVEEFLLLHARSRMQAESRDMIEHCLETANALSGEPFSRLEKVTRLSGGQARALMIADAVCISPSPILLIDEIENAGIDRIKAMELLTSGNKIVLLATHDPLLALSASKRVVLRNGGICAVLETSQQEKDSLRRLIKNDNLNTYLRDAIRAGERIS